MTVRERQKEAAMAETVHIVDSSGMVAPDFWNVTWDVYPTIRGVSTDVMLVQSLLVAYFLSPAGVRPDLKAQAVAIFSRSRRRFDDGIYGDNTREVVRLFEEDMRAP